jgi:hypothetical protein
MPGWVLVSAGCIVLTVSETSSNSIGVGEGETFSYLSMPDVWSRWTDSCDIIAVLVPFKYHED